MNKFSSCAKGWTDGTSTEMLSYVYILSGMNQVWNRRNDGVCVLVFFREQHKSG